jgi:hypothetical protein
VSTTNIEPPAGEFQERGGPAGAALLNARSRGEQLALQLGDAALVAVAVTDQISEQCARQRLVSERSGDLMSRRRQGQ